MLTTWLGDFVARLLPAQYWGSVVLGLLLMAVLLVVAFRRLRYLRLIDDMPTARVRSAPQGYVELEGRAEAPRRPLLSPLRGIPCAWWSYRIESFDASGPSRLHSMASLATLVFRGRHKRRAGQLTESGQSQEMFLIRDSTGACLVDPANAEVVAAETHTWLKGSQRFQESVIRVGAPLYALGLFRTANAHADATERKEIGELISTWKLDRLELAKRFDADRDGEIDDSEWETAWRAATAEIRARRGGREPEPELHVLCSPGDRRPFMLSALGQERLASRYWFESFTSLVTAASVAALVVWSLSARGIY